jgi:hypothetical protein
LRHTCAEALISDKRLLDNHDLRVDRLTPDYWAGMRVMLKPEPYGLIISQTAKTNGSQIPLYRNGALVAVEIRREEERWSLFFGERMEDLRRRVAEDYVRRGLVDSPDAVRIIAADAVPEAGISSK